jgi:hypothetical protein
LRIKLRGIYSLALARLVMDAGHEIVDPNSEVARVLGLTQGVLPEEILVQDRYTLHGVDLIGESEKVWEILRLFQLRLFDTVLVRLDPDEEMDGWVRATVEFPGASKAHLDRIRGTMVPTVDKHHRLKIVDPKAVSKFEQAIRDGSSGSGGQEDLFQELVMGALARGGSVRLEHVRVGSRPPRPREAVLLEVTSNGFVAKRRLSPGWYDGLDMPIEEGDYAITEVREGAWSVRHVYYSASGVLKGEYHNINTPVELYPYGARYVDLEVDVVKRPGEPPFVVDRERLELLARQGYVSEELKRKALDTANGIMERLSS